ncbi:MAG TPA: hypothetical protein VNC78_10765 [Actinomycetota bacterium]|nr:hypothetical protein [Actinomycetota bacterium]
MAENQDLEAKIESLAAKMLRSGEHELPDMDAARRAARRMLEESEARTFDPAVTDHESDDVIRRSSGETAATGETGGTRWVSDGE